MKQRDRTATAVYRAALGAIDNAEAIPLGHEHRAGAIELSPAGVGRAEVPRRKLSERDMVEIVVAEAQERSDAAILLETTNPSHAQQLRHEANLLLTLVDPPEAD